MMCLFLCFWTRSSVPLACGWGEASEFKAVAEGDSCRRRSQPRNEDLCPSCDKQTVQILGMGEVGKDPREHAKEARSQTEPSWEGYQVSLPRRSHISIYP